MKLSSLIEIVYIDPNSKRYLIEDMERKSPQEIKEFVFWKMSAYVTMNKQDEGFQAAWALGMKYFPKHTYNGKMYRCIAVGGDHSTDSDKKINQAIIQNQKRQVMRMMKDHPRTVYSFTTNKDYVTTQGKYDSRGVIIIEQTGIAFNVISFLDEFSMEIEGQEYWNEFPSQKEVLASFQPTAKVMAMFEFRKGDPNYVDPDEEFEL